MSTLAPECPTLTLPTTDSGGGNEHDGLAHYVRKDQMTDAAVFGQPLVAMCGRKFIPTRDGTKYPVCPTCKDLYDKAPKGEDQ